MVPAVVGVRHWNIIFKIFIALLQAFVAVNSRGASMAANAMVAGPSVLLPGKALCRGQQRAAAQRQTLGSSFAKGSSSPFAGQSLRLEASSGAGGTRRVATMAAKSESFRV